MDAWSIVIFIGGMSTGLGVGVRCSVHYLHQYLKLGKSFWDVSCNWRWTIYFANTEQETQTVFFF